jgi:hypothetical protein
MLRYFTGIESLLAPDTGVAPDRPVTLWMGREVLAAVVEDNLANIRRNRTCGSESDAERERYDGFEAERRAFLEWVRGWGGVNILVDLVPRTDVAPDPGEHGEPVAHDEDLDPPPDEEPAL